MLDFILLIPHYNNKEGLLRSLRSVVYPPGKFEVLIVDDGSTLPLALADLQSITQKGIRIHLFPLSRNSGITTALNTGLDLLAKRNDYSFVARLDCGDECSDDRFIKQVAFMREHPNIMLMGTWCRFLNRQNGSSYVYTTRISHEDIYREMHYKCSFIHPTVMFAHSLVKLGYRYPVNFPYAEDYAFFFEIIKKNPVAILPEILVTTEENTMGISIQKRKRQLLSRKAIIQTYGTLSFNIFSGLFRLSLMQIIPMWLIRKLKRYF